MHEYMNGHHTETTIHWVNSKGEPCGVSLGVTPSNDHVQKVIHGEALDSLSSLFFRDPTTFRAGELHRHYNEWQKLAGDNASPQHMQVLHGSVINYLFYPTSDNREI